MLVILLIKNAQPAQVVVLQRDQNLLDVTIVPAEEKLELTKVFLQFNKLARSVADMEK